MKGFIKSGAPNPQKGKKKKKKKKDDSSESGALYESIKKIKVHDKYNNEIDALLEGTDVQDIKKDDDVEIKEISDHEDEECSDEEEDLTEQMAAVTSAKDRKKALLSLLDKHSAKTGA